MDFSLSNLKIETLVLFGINFFINIILIFLLVSNKSKINKLKRKYNRFMSGEGDKNIEEILEKNLDKTDEIILKNKEIEDHLKEIDNKIIKCVQKVGIIRYNAFDNVGSDLSFSIALLDINDDGFVLSGIYSRESSSTYAKPIKSGKSTYILSVEEVQAVELAKKSS
ncbi:MAG: DUF4446 family protein [Bacillota bacterium]|nr:DUF4446 family protein [Bacillota bacterium]